MIPDENLAENSLLVVTGSSLRAELADRPLAYRMKTFIEQKLEQMGFDSADPTVAVLSDLWYLNVEALHRLPTISLGGPKVNALSAYLSKRLSNALVVDNALIIQMDLDKEDLRACIWGSNCQNTASALDIFVKKGYLEQFLHVAAARLI